MAGGVPRRGADTQARQVPVAGQDVAVDDAVNEQAALQVAGVDADHAAGEVQAGGGVAEALIGVDVAALNTHDPGGVLAGAVQEIHPGDDRRGVAAVAGVVAVGLAGDHEAFRRVAPAPVADDLHPHRGRRALATAVQGVTQVGLAFEPRLGGGVPGVARDRPDLGELEGGDLGGRDQDDVVPIGGQVIEEHPRRGDGVGRPRRQARTVGPGGQRAELEVVQRRGAGDQHDAVGRIRDIGADAAQVGVVDPDAGQARRSADGHGAGRRSRSAQEGVVVERGGARAVQLGRGGEAAVAGAVMHVDDAGVVDHRDIGDGQGRRRLGRARPAHDDRAGVGEGVGPGAEIEGGGSGGVDRAGVVDRIVARSERFGARHVPGPGVVDGHEGRARADRGQLRDIDLAPDRAAGVVGDDQAAAHALDGVVAGLEQGGGAVRGDQTLVGDGGEAGRAGSGDHGQHGVVGRVAFAAERAGRADGDGAGGFAGDDGGLAAAGHRPVDVDDR